jgi:hypothetical protein
VDKGQGGKYLILPPAYDRDKVAAGYIPMPSDTYQGYALLRSVLKSGSDADIDKAVAYGKLIKLYPLSQAANPRRQHSSMRAASCSTPRSPTICASSNRSIEWCRPSRGWNGTRR